MIVETALLLGGAVVTAMLGVPVVTRLASPAGARQPAPRDPSSGRTAQEARKAFEPLDLGPDKMSWPSEVERPIHGRPEPKWPSETWDDPHFGSRSKGRLEKRSPERAADAGQRSAGRSEEQQALREAAARAREHIQSNAQRQQTPDRDLSVKAAGPASRAPSADELERLVATVGLAGTVQEIMNRTGWDFRQAAHHLARTRQASR